MTWKLTEWGKTRMPLPGIPWRDMTDEEFATACADNPGLEKRGYFDDAREPEPRAAAAAPADYVPKANRPPRRNQR